MADKVAGKQKRELHEANRLYEWDEITAREAIASLPQENDVYFGDVTGQPSALYGLMHQAHRIRMNKYKIDRDTKRGAVKWTDDTIAFAATAFNGKRKSVSKYAHTARIIWDKHWHGSNRQKRTRLSEEEREVTKKCHMCGGIDSQHHGFRWCTHSNVKAV